MILQLVAYRDCPPSLARVSVPGPEYYRQKAEECRQRAERASDPDVKDRWMTLVGQWERLAEEVQGRQRSGFAGEAGGATEPEQPEGEG